MESSATLTVPPVAVIEEQIAKLQDEIKALRRLKKVAWAAEDAQVMAARRKRLRNAVDARNQAANN